MFLLTSSLVAGGLGFGIGTLSKSEAKKKKIKNQAEIVKNEIAFCLTGMDAHITRTMDQARVEEDPFPHLLVENFLPDSLYRHACELWPDSSEFAGAKDAKRFVLPPRTAV